MTFFSLLKQKIFGFEDKPGFFAIYSRNQKYLALS